MRQYRAVCRSPTMRWSTRSRRRWACPRMSSSLILISSASGPKRYYGGSARGCKSKWWRIKGLLYSPLNSSCNIRCFNQITTAKAASHSIRPISCRRATGRTSSSLSIPCRSCQQTWVTAQRQEITTSLTTWSRMSAQRANRSGIVKRSVSLSTIVRWIWNHQ